jgi:NADP-dependent 3-hydroxy acid dehydrogenase YdfG
MLGDAYLPLPPQPAMFRRGSAPALSHHECDLGRLGLVGLRRDAALAAGPGGAGRIAGMTGVAVVTGASSGIGAATAVRLAEAGYHVVAAARRSDRVEALAEQIRGKGGRAEARTLDVTDRAAVDALAASLDRCDVLVANAGGAVGGDQIADGSPDDWRAMYEVNVLGTLNVTQALLPALVASGAGTVVVMGSTAGFVAYEGGGGYVAAKHGAHALAATLRLELYDKPVRVIEIAPGMVKTDEFALNRFRGDAGKAAAVYAGVAEPLTADDVADAVTWAVTRPAHFNVDLMVIRPRAQAAQHKVYREG